MSIRRPLRVVAYGALLLITLILILLIVAGTSSTALRWIVTIAEDRTPVVIAGVNGSLLGGLRVRSLTAEGEGWRVDLHHLELNVRWQCLWRSEVCIERAAIGEVLLELAEEASGGAKGDVAEFPDVPDFRLDDFFLDSLTIVRGGQQEIVRGLALRSRYRDDELRVDRFSGKHRYGAWRGDLQIAETGSWAIDLNLQLGQELRAELGEDLPDTYTLAVKGDLRAAEGSVTAPADASIGLEFSGQEIEGKLQWNAELRHADLLTQRIPGGFGAWVQPVGALQHRGTYDGEVLRLQGTQTLVGFESGPHTAKIDLSLRGGQLQLNSATLADGARTRLRTMGPLGSPEALTPELNFLLDDFRAPVEAGLAVDSFSGTAEMRAIPAQGAWSVRSGGLSLERNGQVFQFSGALESSADPLLPLGSLQGLSVLAGSDRPMLLLYDRPGDDADAVLSIEGIPPAGELSIDDAQLRVSSDEVRRLALTTGGDLEADLRLSARRSLDGVDLKLEPTVIDLRGETLQTRRPVTLRWSADEAALYLDALCVHWRESRLCTDPTTLGETGALAANLWVDESYEGRFGDQPFRIAARGEGAASIQWQGGEVSRTDFHLDLDALEVDPLLVDGSARPLRWEQVRVFGGIDDGPFLDASLSSETLGEAHVKIRERGDALAGSFTAPDLDLQPWADLVPEIDLREGTLSAELSLAGTLEQPRIEGSAAVRGLSAAVDRTSSGLEDTDLLLVAEDQGLRLTGSGIFGGGPFEVTGLCCSGERLSAKISGQRNQLALANGLSASVSPLVDVVLEADALAISGELTVHDGVFEHRSPRDEGVSVSPDIRRVDRGETGPRRFAVNVDLRTIIEPGFTLRSREIESTLSGDVRVQLEDRQPLEVYGDLRVLGGELRALGQVLRLSEGVVGFVGDPMNPDLNLSAEREIRAENLRVGFRVQGTLEEPSLTLFSDPKRSERDTLSYLIRGRGPDAGATVDSTAMALSLGATAVNQSGVLRRLESIPGLSDITIGAEGSDDDVAATISAYVGRRLFLSYGVGLYEPVNALTVRLYLRSRLWLEVVSRLESSFDLYYRFDRN